MFVHASAKDIFPTRVDKHHDLELAVLIRNIINKYSSVF